jgi:hypothetical protein
MSAIAEFFKLPTSLLDDLEEAATPGPPGFSYLDYLRKTANPPPAITGPATFS